MANGPLLQAQLAFIGWYLPFAQTTSTAITHRAATCAARYCGGTSICPASCITSSSVRHCKHQFWGMSHKLCVVSVGIRLHALHSVRPVPVGMVLLCEQLRSSQLLNNPCVQMLTRPPPPFPVHCLPRQAPLLPQPPPLHPPPLPPQP